MPFSSKPDNFPLGTLVTWRTNDRSSWIEILELRFGKGPFEVIHAEYSLYNNPKVSLANRRRDEILFYGEGLDLFYKSWLEEFSEVAGSQ